MSELWYVLNHWVTVVWLALAALYVYYAVLADVIAMVRDRNKKGPSPKA